MGNATIVHVSDPDTVRGRTGPDANDRIDQHAEQRIREAAADSDFDDRLDTLDHEWNFERVIETEAAATGLIGLLLAARFDRRFLVIPGVVASMMLLHALHGCYPLLPLLRRIGIRTQNEIDAERHAIKMLRGDFSRVHDAESERRAEEAWRAVHL